VDLLQLYGEPGRRYLQVVDFSAHQQGLTKRARSKCPDPPEIPESLGKLVLTELNRTEPKRTELEISAETSSAPPVLTFPTVGREGTTWLLTEAHVAEWQPAYPTLGVLAECRKALAWVKADPTRRKTGGGMTRFLVNWLNRATNAGGHVRGDSYKHSNFEPTSAQYQYPCPHETKCVTTLACCHKQDMERAKVIA
jgi:hypothetical protein